MKTRPHSHTRRLDLKTLHRATHILCRAEPRFAEVVDKHGFPPLWDRKPGFKTLIRIILEQQVSLSSAKATYDRLQSRLTDINENNFLQLNDEELFSVGFSRQKRQYCRNLARAILAGELTLDNNNAQTDTQMRIQLQRIKGIGDWTVDIYFLMALKRPDIWPRSDLALAQAVQELFDYPVRPGNDEMHQLGLRWKPWRAVAARILWHYYLNSRSKD